MSLSENRSEAEEVGNDELLIELITKLAKELHPEAPPRILTLNSSLEKECGVDSLGRIELLLRIEKTFGRTLNEEEAIAAESINDLLQALNKLPTDSSVRQHKSNLKSTEQHKTSGEQKLEQGSEEQLPVEAETLVDVLDFYCEQSPEREYIHLYRSGFDEITTITYRNLYEESLRVASGLRGSDINPRDSVGIMLPTSQEYLNLFFGILLAGAVPIPIYPPQRMSQLEEHLGRQLKILRNGEVRILITVPEALRLRPLLKSALPDLREVITYDELISRNHPNPRVKASPSDTAFIQYTSGSTGNPKGVVLSHANLLANVRAMGEATRITHNDVFVSWLPLYHDMGLIGAWFGSLYFRMKLVLMSPLTFMARPSRWLRAISDFHGTLSAAPNFAYEICSNRIPEKELVDIDLSSWRWAFNGAEPVNPETLEAFIERFANYGFKRSAMAPVFGLAENSVGLLFPPADRGPFYMHVQREKFLKEGLVVKASSEERDGLTCVTCGKPIPGHEVRLVGKTGDVIGENEVGLLQFRGPSATAGYRNNPGATDKLYSGDWLNTGDYAFRRHGEIYITGRQKEMIIRGGRNIYPYELEEAVGKINGLRTGGVAVFGSISSEDRSERLIVVAETRERKSERLSKIRAEIEAESLMLFQVPPDDIILAQPRTVLKTSSGKIRRTEMRQRYEAGRLGKSHKPWSQVLRLFLASTPALLKRSVRFSGRVTYGVYAWLLAILLVPPTWLLSVIIPFYDLRYRFFRGMARLALKLCGIKFRVSGLENIPETRPLVLAANHASYLDGLYLIAAFPFPLRFVVKKELQKTFFTRIFLNRLNVAYVERFDAQAGLGDTRKIADETDTTKTAPLVFFPEGTFTRTEGLLPFRMGAFVVAVHSAAPVVPVIMNGARHILRGEDKLLNRGSITIEITPPIHPEKSGWTGAIELRDSVRQAILKSSIESELD